MMAVQWFSRSISDQCWEGVESFSVWTVNSYGNQAAGCPGTTRTPATARVKHPLALKGQALRRECAMD